MHDKNLKKNLLKNVDLKKINFHNHRTLHKLHINQSIKKYGP